MKRIFLIISCLISLGDSVSHLTPIKIDFEKFSSESNESTNQIQPFNNQICQNQLNQFSNALSNREFWALQLFDTWAKIQAGFLSGNIINIGDFDRCVRFRHETQANEIIQGQHCHVGILALPNSTLEGGHDGFDWREL